MTLMILDCGDPLVHGYNHCDITCVFLSVLRFQPNLDNLSPQLDVTKINKYVRRIQPRKAKTRKCMVLDGLALEQNLKPRKLKSIYSDLSCQTERQENV